MLTIKNISSLEKVLFDSECSAQEINKGSALLNEEFSYQIAFKSQKEEEISYIPLQIEIESDIAECVSVFIIRNVPVLLNHFYGSGDENYLSRSPGLFPDVLEPYTDYVMVSPKNYGAIWVSVKANDTVTSGAHEIKIIFKNEGEVWGESVFTLDIIGKALPELDIPYTNWFHCDCISSYYGLEPLSEEHWNYIEKYLAVATKHGINMLLTPIFTPPLDTKVGSERPTVQLVDVFCNNGVYTFKFDKLIRWMQLCKKYNVKYLEISHLYTQWGAAHAPKIVVYENGEYIYKFGWETDALGNEYKDFLTQFIPQLCLVLENNWNKENIFFHISDEPHAEHIEHYGQIFNFIKPLLGEFKQMDAISDYDLYSKGYIQTPVVVTNEIYKFIENKVDNLWAYYCCGPDNHNFSNRLIAMPSYRTRIMGMQLYKYNIKGFLHWGYNFFYSRLSTHLINPYITTDSEGGFPAGDAFVVYPARDGAIPAIRLKVFFQGLQDLMAAKLLESYVGKDAVLKIIDKYEAIDFSHYPQNAEFILSVRETINEWLKEFIN